VPESITLFWFRRDLRLEDNTGLFQALNRHKNVQPIFIFDTDILEKLEDKSDKRVSFIYERIERLKLELEAIGSTLWVFSGKPIEIFQKIIDQHQMRFLRIATMSHTPERAMKAYSTSLARKELILKPLRTMLSLIKTKL